MHPAAIYALAQAELAVLRAWPQAPRCRAGHHVGGPGCHAHADPIPDAGETIHAVPFEVWAACPTTPTALGLEDWAPPTR